MPKKQARVYLAAEIAASLLSLCSGVAAFSPLPLVNAAPNAQTNPHYTAAISRLKQEDLQGAMGELNQAIQLDPSLADAYTLRGILHMGNRDPLKAAEDFTQVTRLQPKSAEAYINLTKSQLMLKDYRTALQSATKAKQLDPQSQDAALLVNLAQSLVDAAQ
ncbi:MAG: tetratricopeptide repeat protein [Acaryochloris sp. RU_4_1]|nr:tetratricopeptide repeat protein [Acaryochloris sp. RU_4_1]NJR56815.1 tetratricopeptide repeat protein [Acaryochloris sp. CRU_2_0]